MHALAKEGIIRFYLAGRMSGVPRFNFPLFIEAAEDLRSRGFEVISPAELDDPETRELALASPDGSMGSGSHNGETWGDFLSRDCKIIADQVDGVIVLPDWQSSRGARLETYLASELCKKPIFEYSKGFMRQLSDRELIMAWIGVDIDASF